MALVAGDFVDRYRIVARLGAGGMGEVFRAHDTRLQRDVALKILHPDPSSGSGPQTGGAARLLREARSVAALEHPNVITIHDVGEITEPASLAGTPYIAMELIKGKSLREHMAGPAPFSERLGWLLGAAQGLAAAHKAGLVHRDVKPENIMVRDDGVVKVLDFGIAKRAYPSTSVDPTSSTEAQLLPQLSTQGVVVGTPYYMAPEQMRNEALDGRADQFSWAVVAYELLAGRPPWTMGGDALQLVSEILSRQPPSLRALNPEIPPAVEAILARALAKSRDERFPSMNAVLDALSPGVPSFRSLPAQPSPFARTESIAPAAPSGPTPPQTPPIVTATSPGVPRSAGRARWAMALGVGALAMVAFVVYRHLSAPVPAVSAPPATPSASIKDDKGPETNVPAALDSYRAAMDALRDADIERGRRALDEAIHADPRFAAAHLRYGITRVPPDETGRIHLVEATRLHSSLSEHDQALVRAFAPLSSAPGDLPETEKRLAELVAGSPGDADFTLQLCKVRGALELANTVDTCRRASELDPGAAAPLRALAIAQGKSGDARDALASFDACLRAFPLATSCLVPLWQLQSVEGQCDAALTSARRLVSADPDSPEPYDALADSLLAVGQPLDGVRAALADELARVPADDAPTTKAMDEAALAIRIGDFARADAQLRAWDDLVAARRLEADHFLVSAYRVMLAIEQGRVQDARTLATSYLARRGAWTSQRDQSIFFDGALYRIGAITKDELVKRRTAWLSAQKGEGSRLGFLWIFAYAETAFTADDGREAIEALPSYLPLPGPLMRLPDYELPIGKAYHLAGRDAEAVPYLRRAANACASREAPFESTWASFALGEALEKQGDTAGACVAYGVVRKRWLNAAGSVTERHAEARISALGCAR